MAKQLEDFDANLAGEEGKTEETKSSWFKRIKKGINTKTSEKKETAVAEKKEPEKSQAPSTPKPEEKINYKLKHLDRLP